MLRDALFHDAFRRLPPVLLGVLLLHLPTSWQRLEYLAQSGREGSVSVMDAVELQEAAFAVKFPEYPKWKCWNGDQARQVRRRQGSAMPPTWCIISKEWVAAYCCSEEWVAAYCCSGLLTGLGGPTGSLYGMCQEARQHIMLSMTAQKAD
jgi:hypothetical protein